METLSYEKVIDAPRQAVWDVLWGNETYPQWTQFFEKGSEMKSDWQVGGKTYFLNAEGRGMVSTIDSLQQPDHVVFKHLGTVDKEGNEDTRSRDVMQWSGFYERYLLIDFEGRTKLHIEVQADKNWHDRLEKGFTEGLEIVRQLAEQGKSYDRNSF
ncbi:SRPBCC domain-containing protein [uncultured Chryseobacterium sp.]|uniref:SRPBCC family protein n=1 Tax=uncultured Chryseobacterium sp. TaxID=259322 RepID=UPI0025DA923D|nr:SRPBCC domain-containing protein [uncultured Chryseobacterium sp.]